MRVALILLLALALTACASAPPPPVTKLPPGTKLRPWQKPYTVYGKRYYPLLDHKGFVESGVASWYGADFHGRKTSNGEIYDMYAMTAAHKVLPLGVHVRVKNLDNGRETVVRVNDRGPFVKNRIIDLSYSAAKELGVVGPGTARVSIEALGYPEGATGGEVVAERASYREGPFAVQVASFGVRDNAQRLSRELKGRFGEARITEVLINDRPFYRVWAGKYRSLEEAEQGRQELAAAGYGEGMVVALD